MNGWREATDGLLEEMGKLASDIAALARWHAGKPGAPPFEPPEGRKPRLAASYAKAAAEITRSLALAGVRVEELRAEEQKRARLGEDAEESRRRVAEWERTHP